MARRGLPLERILRVRTLQLGLVRAEEAQAHERLASEARRYSALYGVNPYVEDHYDIVINTASSTPEESTQQIIKAYKAWLS